MADEHGAGAKEVVDVFVAAGVADSGGIAFGDDDVFGDVAEAAAGQELMGFLDKFGFGWRNWALLHWAFSLIR